MSVPFLRVPAHALARDPGVPRFADRRAAGRALAQRLRDLADVPDLLVLGLPRGGVPVAYEIARALHAELDVLVVRKLGVPGQPELAMGAIGPGGVAALNERVIAEAAVAASALQQARASEQHELERRERAYRAGLPPLRLRGRTVIVVDDGLATGATMRAALAVLRGAGPARIVVALPVAPPDAAQMLLLDAPDLVVVAQPRNFDAVGRFYADFGQTDDDEVRGLLARARAGAGASRLGTRRAAHP